MTDTTLAQILDQCLEQQHKTLLVLDENASALPTIPASNVVVLSNRIDIVNAITARQWSGLFSDFDFDALEDFVAEKIIYRISKEKRVVEHVLQSGWQRLAVGGEFCVAGYKNEGIKTFAKRVQLAWRCEGTLTRGDAQLHIYRFLKTASAATPLNEDNYRELHEIGKWQNATVFSKPGIFAWDRFDEGSLFLLEHLHTFLQQSDYKNQKALDLGCGNGLLAIALYTAGCSSIFATDNNAAAIRACSINFSHNNISGNVIAADCAASITERFDLVVCNPPFHQGFGVEQDLTDRFLQATKRLLARRGRALFVVNAFIPLEKKATPLFGQVQTVANNQRFKLVQLGL